MAITHATSAPGTPPPAGLTVGGNEWNAAHVGGVDISALAGDLLPSVDDLYSLGSASKRWSEGWIGGSHFWHDEFVNPRIDLIADDGGNAQINVLGAGAELNVSTAPGSADNNGGNISFAAGSSIGQGGGSIDMVAGQDSGGGDGGSVTLRSGATTGVDAGDAGELAVRGGNSSDGAGGRVIVAAGNSDDGSGGNITIQAGTSANTANHGRIDLYDGTGTNGIEISKNGLLFFAAVPPSVPATPTAQDIVDALVTLGLIAQSP